MGKSQFLFGFKDGGERVKFTSDDYKICIHKKYFEQGGAAAGLKRKNYLYYEVKNETIKIHLDIDKEQEEKTAYFYDWVPSTGNLFYCMPKVGTKVSLYICNRDEQSAKAINCVRTNGENCSELQNYNNRYFTSEHNKRIYLLPDEMGIQGAHMKGLFRVRL